jgi:hypothetical protein
MMVFSVPPTGLDRPVPKMASTIMSESFMPAFRDLSFFRALDYPARKRLEKSSMLRAASP